MVYNIGRSIMNMVEVCKDSVSASISEAAATGRINVDPASIPVLIKLVTSTIDACYHNAARVIERDVAAATASPQDTITCYNKATPSPQDTSSNSKKKTAKC